VAEVLRYTGHEAEIVAQPEMPTGPMNRVADNERASRVLGWKPEVPFVEGLHRTIDWYFSTKVPEDVRRILEDGGLVERRVELVP
jgi:nucleoside-diphosphate-sugar epimerase